MNNILKPIQAVLGIILAGVMLYLLADQFAPGLTAKARSFFHENALEWSQEDIEKDPLRYLSYAQKDLQTQRTQLGGVINEILSNIVPLDQVIQQQSEKLDLANLYLGESKEIYQQAMKVSLTSPVEYRGKLYPNLDSYRNQIQVWFNERKGIQSVLESATETRQQLNDKLYSMQVQQSNLDTENSLIPAKSAVIKAGQAANQYAETVAAVRNVTHEVLTSTHKLLEDNPIRTIEQVTKDSLKIGHMTSGSLTAEFENFLKIGQ